MADIGRPTKLTPERHDKIVQAMRLGSYADVAARHGGIGSTTYHKWMRWGKRDKDADTDSIYRAFRSAIKNAEADAELRAVQVILTAMPESWQAAMTFLERRYPSRWGRRGRLDISSEGGPLIQVNVDGAALGLTEGSPKPIDRDANQVIDITPEDD